MNKSYERFLERSRRRRAEAIRWRKMGYSFVQIGAFLNVSRQRAHQLVNGK